jgi:hypothetical protein
MRAIDDILTRAKGRRGAALLRTVLAEHRVGSTPTRNVLEEAFLRICRDVALPPDAVNQWIAYPDGSGAEADFLWRAQRLIVEVDAATRTPPAAPSNATAAATSDSCFWAGASSASHGAR